MTPVFSSRKIMTEHTVNYGTTPIRFELSYADRKTLNITVHPEDLRVTVTAPEGASLEAVKAHVLKRASWILDQQQDLARYWPPVPPRQYLSGEAHWYLGRKLRLKVLESPVDIVKPTRTTLRAYVRDTDPDHVRGVVHDWYRKRAKTVFAARLDACYPKAQHLGIAKPELRVRAMEARWGSTKEGTVTLNTKLVQAPKSCIDYVIYHELAHIAAPDHGAGFYELLTRLAPDWEAQREALNTFRQR
jgi:hypothetical protein